MYNQYSYNGIVFCVYWRNQLSCALQNISKCYTRKNKDLFFLIFSNAANGLMFFILHIG